MEYNNQIEYEAALEKGREYLLRQSGLSKRQLKYDMDYVEGIIHAEQKTALYACNSFVDKYIGSVDTDGLILIGTVGCGKTMLAAYIIHYLIYYNYSDSELVEFSNNDQVNYQCDMWRFSLFRDSKYLMLNISYFLSELRAYTGIESRNIYSDIMNMVKQADVLIFDDLGSEKSTEWTQSVLFEIIDYRYNNNLPIIITTNCLPEELKEKIGERSIDRLREMCKLVTINHGSFRKTAE